ncbi:MAG: hypothetical protein OFPII_29030 [Osedax symbiont Rs1]|nr:MAG: hypothetical protein OFPII_29030 [Osedax symbiont Rs1]
MNTDSRWLIRSQPQPDAIYRLLCLPYAGGNASLFHSWPAQLPELDMLAVQPPGRASRLMEPNCRDMSEYVEGLLLALEPWLDRNWAIFGHSMGALAGYALLQRLQRSGLPLPDYFFISASKGPQVENRIKKISYLDDECFIEELKKLNGTPTQVLENQELINFCLPFIRADFHLIENYLLGEFKPLPVTPILLCGTEDDITPQDMLLWNKLFKKSATVSMFPGNHFFLHEEDNLKNIFQLIKRHLPEN